MFTSADYLCPLCRKPANPHAPKTEASRPEAPKAGQDLVFKKGRMEHQP